MDKFLIVFIALSIVNVIFATVKSIVTVGDNKWVASLVSGGYFAFYNVMMLYTVADFPMWQKCVITFVCNVMGVYLVKWGEEKARKEKLWKIEATIYEPYTESLRHSLENAGIPNHYIPNIGKYTVFNCYCATKAESKVAKSILDFHKAKYFVSESKTL